jgi:hypothetical protein
MEGIVSVARICRKGWRHKKPKYTGIQTGFAAKTNAHPLKLLDFTQGPFKVQAEPQFSGWPGPP